MGRSVFQIVSLLGGVYMKPTSPTWRASPLARAVFHPHFTREFTWRTSSSKRARYLDVFLLLWIKIINEQCIDAKMSGPPP